jgi:hypothetical protein
VISNEGIRCVLTVLFVALGAVYLAAAARALRQAGSAGWRPALAAGLHVLMCAAMISMFWPWGAAVPAIALVTVFTAAAGWFAGQAVFGAAGQQGAAAENWSHAGMMAVMVWMAVTAPLMAGPAASGLGRPPGGAMAGMDMGGQPAGGAGPVMAAGSPGWAGPVCLVLAVALLAYAAWRAVALLSVLAAPGQPRIAGLAPWLGGGQAVAARDAGLAVMAAGMAAALLAMT